MMYNRIIIHATGTTGGESLSLDEIKDMRTEEDPRQDPMPYHYVIDVDGRIMKGKRDSQLCGHCGRFSRGSLSVAYVGGIVACSHAEPAESAEDNIPQFANTMTAKQEIALRFLVNELLKRNPGAEVIGANALLHPDEPLEDNEPYFDVQGWW